MEDTATLKHRLEEVLAALAPEGEAAPPPPLEEFARRLLARATKELLEGRPPEWVAGEVRSIWRLLAETGEDDIGVRVRPLPDAPGRFVVRTAMVDRPFIVDTLREHLHARGYSILQLLHPILGVERDAAGEVVHVDGREREAIRTSVTFILCEGELEEGRQRELRAEIVERLEKVCRATADFEAMLTRCDEVGEELEGLKEQLPWRSAELTEIQELLRWLQDGGFVFLGYREYELVEAGGEEKVRVRDGSGLGILRDESASRYRDPVPVSELPPEIQARLLGGPLLLFSKSNSLSPVHRHAPMDYLGIKELGPDGEVRGERRFLGLLTSRAYSQDASQIPILRRKLREVLEAEGAVRGSHDYNRIHRIFNSMPKEELFTSTAPELLRTITTVMETEGAEEVRITAREDSLGRGVNVMVILPAAKFSAGIRRKIQEELVRTYRGELLNYHLSMGGGDQARLHFYLSSELEEIGDVKLEELEERVRQSARSWEERLTDALRRGHEADEARDLAERHRDEFSPEYMAEMDVETALRDIQRLESLESTGVQQAVMEPLDGDRSHAFRLKVYAPKGIFVLSDVMPTLENLGFRVLEADKYEVGGAGGMPASIHTFDVETPKEWEVEREEVEPRVADALRAVRGRRTEDDRLNSLVLSAGLDWWQVALLRAYSNYAFRIGAVTSRVAVRRPLTEYPRCTRLLFEHFRRLHDPAVEGDRGERSRAGAAEFEDALHGVRGIDDDRAFRQLLQLVEGTVRTNFFQARARERTSGMIALKFDCDRVEFMPRPRPRYEVYVNSAETEGAHLRMGAVARGGIRWSDRTEDFRVEVLGLVKTQQVKNAVIVPAGAKGAYVVKRPPAESGARREAGEASYREFIRGLLDVTDNLEGDEVRHPPETVIRDGDDPYLVVAADKGTAHLSDTANQIAAEYDFWLDDAFASGGSHGYDHKKLGITGRGVWECVTRHFREMGRDVQEETFTVVGIGDMSGDVFGNGMLLSREIQLVAAFDHRHVFLDPDPDPERSWQERKRLYEMPGSTWADYDEDAISEGGGVYSRETKSISLSPQARERLDVDREETSANALIRAVLRAPVDLLFNGGIGTYVKASDESNAEVEDPGNDETRVDGREVRARVVGEGGNLGFTQKARVEYALNGGRINTDAVDNSAGVDMSDHEVNLKILFTPLVRGGELDREARTDLLRAVEDEVAEQVLRDNYLQSLAVTLERHRAREVPPEFRDALTYLERARVLDRQMENLPGTEDLVERQEEGEHLTRPELCVLMAYAKLDLKRHLNRSELSDDEATAAFLSDYVPDRVAEIVGEERVREHRLGRRLVSTGLANLFVNRMGATGHVQLSRETGRAFADIVKAWYAAYRIGQAEELYRSLEGQDYRVPAGVQTQWFLGMSEALENATRWLLASGDSGASVAELVERYGEPVAELRERLPGLLTERRRQELRNRRSLHEMDGAEEALAGRLATFGYLDTVLPIAQLSAEVGLAPTTVGKVYFALNDEVDFPWLEDRLAGVAGSDLWEQRAAKTLSLQLAAARSRLAAMVLEGMGEEEGVTDALSSFRDRSDADLGRVREVVADVRSEERPSISALMVAVNAITAETQRSPDGSG